MFINFDLSLANSITISGNTASISLSFTVTSSTVAPDENNENDDNGEIEDVHGKVTDVTAPNFTIQTSQSTITFVTDSNTRFTDGLTSLADVKVGDVLEVDGFTKADGTKVAARVGPEEAATLMEVERIVDSWNRPPRPQTPIPHQADPPPTS